MNKAPRFRWQKLAADFANYLPPFLALPGFRPRLAGDFLATTSASAASFSDDESEIGAASRLTSRPRRLTKSWSPPSTDLLMVVWPK